MMGNVQPGYAMDNVLNMVRQTVGMQFFSGTGSSCGARDTELIQDKRQRQRREFPAMRAR